MTTYQDSDITRVLYTKLRNWNFDTDKSHWSQEKRSVLNALLDHGADMTIRDKDGNLPFFLAAATLQVSLALMMIGVAAKQGLFDRYSKTSTTRSKKSHGIHFVTSRSKGCCNHDVYNPKKIKSSCNTKHVLD